MFRDALIIFRKEVANVARNRRAIVTNYVLPLIIMPIMFGAIGAVTSGQEEAAREATYDVNIRNAPDGRFGEILAQMIRFRAIDEANREDAITVTFPAGWSPAAADRKATVVVAYSSTSNKQRFAAGAVQSAISQYEREISNRILADHGLTLADIEPLTIEERDLAPEEAQTSGFLAMMIPYLLVLYLFAGSMAMGLDITAGEKERGSLAGLLVNQVSRTSIATGKVLFVLSSSVVNSISSFIGIVIAGNILSETGGDSFGGGGAVAFLTVPRNVVALLLTFVTVAALAAAIVVLLGSIARNMKEASGYVTPVYLLVIVMGVATMSLDVSENLAFYFVPFLNAVFIIKGIILSEFTALQFAVTLAINVVLAGGLVAVIARLFNGERILNTVG